MNRTVMGGVIRIIGAEEVIWEVAEWDLDLEILGGEDLQQNLPRKKSFSANRKSNNLETDAPKVTRKSRFWESKSLYSFLF